MNLTKSLVCETAKLIFLLSLLVGWESELKVIYFRVKYAPKDYASESEWKGMKCQYLTDTKKVQHELAKPNTLLTGCKDHHWFSLQNYILMRSVYVINGWHPNIHIDTSTPTKKRTILVWRSHFGLQSSLNFVNTQFL
ncbi:unnamed protein product [Lactuca virosa]|uniref:Glutathione synthase substrate-binding domain-containing protein n=1 Tax=Lactuca virosa TaxID=75947 RepID=A0AAU9PX03_9ASTR|nr:unnamed protein product [Lactuca virosa]